jgi:hypothetical protein
MQYALSNMQQTDRPRKVDVVVLGRGLLAATLSLLLAERGKKVALLVETPGWDIGVGSDEAEFQRIGDRISQFEKCYCVVGTRVRGISVIENAVLGAIAEDARYDSRIVINVAEDARHAAFARMMHQPPLTYNGTGRIVPATVKGGWQLEGVVDPTFIPTLAEETAISL